MTIIIDWHFIIITCPTHISRYVSWCTSQYTCIHIEISRGWLLEADEELIAHTYSGSRLPGTANGGLKSP